MELIYRYGSVSQAEIGKALGGLDYTAVSRERKRLRAEAQQERTLRAALHEIETTLTS
jgi:chromosomal replication initiation ATPase DnaA